MRTWRYYRAAAEEYLTPNVFMGMLRPEEGDKFLHYVRVGRLGDGTDYFGVYAVDHDAWLAVQPPNLNVTEIKVEEVPVPNQFTELAAERRRSNVSMEDVGLTTS